MSSSRSPDVDQGESTPQLSETQSVSVDGTVVVTQEYMVEEQLERERIRIEEKKLDLDKKVEEFRRRKSRFVKFYTAISVFCRYTSVARCVSFVSSETSTVFPLRRQVRCSSKYCLLSGETSTVVKTLLT